MGKEKEGKAKNTKTAPIIMNGMTNSGIGS
jgi:hypothetical protein